MRTRCGEDPFSRRRFWDAINEGPRHGDLIAVRGLLGFCLCQWRRFLDEPFEDRQVSVERVGLRPEIFLERIDFVSRAGRIFAYVLQVQSPRHQTR